MDGPTDTLSGGWGDARLPELTARFGHPLNDSCEYASQCVVGALLNAESQLAERDAQIAEMRKALTGNDFRERLADLCHAQWSGWMKYLFGRLTRAVDASEFSRLFTVTDYQRWKRQAEMPYAELSAAEQDSDRKEADRFIALIAAELGLTEANDAG